MKQYASLEANSRLTDHTYMRLNIIKRNNTFFKTMLSVH